ncbi:MAG: hypothetical protein NTV70_03700 [Acidobacteria bacterium]|nr:hypothetical protein [Acidobacteriota bacterium]
MKMTNQIAAATALTLATVAAQTGTVMPARELSIFESQALFQNGTLVQVFPVLKVAAQGRVTSKNGNAADVYRDTNAAAAIYVGASLPNQPQSPQAAFSSPPVNQNFDFKSSGDSAQSFATMQANGLPFLFVRTFGQASGQSAATWTARLQTNGAGATPVYVQFTLPKVTLDGATESDGLSLRQSRFRAELLVNDQPVWHSEAARQTTITNPNVGPELSCAGGSEKNKFLATYGRSIGFTEVEETPSVKQAIFLNLGSFTSAQPVDITLVLRAEAQTKTKCCQKPNPNNDNKQEWFCTDANAKVEWDNTIVNPVRFYVGGFPIRAN